MINLNTLIQKINSQYNIQPSVITFKSFQTFFCLKTKIELISNLADILHSTLTSNDFILNK